MQKLRMVTSAAALSFLILGCEADCESLCEDRKECADASPDERARDCAKSCDEEEKVEERFGCKPQSDDLVDCVANLEELCDPPPDACSVEQAALSQCNSRYCSEHPDDGDCPP
jgi:hypothetical protein